MNVESGRRSPTLIVITLILSDWARRLAVVNSSSCARGRATGGQLRRLSARSQAIVAAGRLGHAQGGLGGACVADQRQDQRLAPELARIAATREVDLEAQSSSGGVGQAFRQRHVKPFRRFDEDIGAATASREERVDGEARGATVETCRQAP